MERFGIIYARVKEIFTKFHLDQSETLNDSQGGLKQPQQQQRQLWHKYMAAGGMRRNGEGEMGCCANGAS